MMTRIDTYCTYAGGTLHANFLLPELQDVAADRQPTFRVTLTEVPLTEVAVEWAHDFPDALGESTLRCERTAEGYRIHFPGVASLVAFADGVVCVHPHPGASSESIRHVLLDQALPRLLAQRGELVLHAAVVSTLSGRTLLLIGDSGRGKSTLTGAFFASGRSVGTDDGARVRVTDAGLVANPTYPSLRLLPDSRAQLFAGVDSALLPVAGYGDKRRLPMSGAMEPAPVDAIVHLAAPAETGTPPRLSRETPGLACMAMIRHGFQLDLTDTSNVQVLLAKAAEAAEMVPVYRLDYPRSYAALPQVIELLEREA